MTLYRVFPYDAGAAPSDRGGALFVPPPTGRARIDNPDLHDVLYVTAQPEAAIAEAFGQLAIWRADTFVRGDDTPYALASFDIAEDSVIFSLDDVDALKGLGITRPSTVVTRDRAKTQAWARTIFERGRYVGASWWSYSSPDWTVMGLWNRTTVTLAGTPEILTATSAIVRETAAAIVRQIAP